MRPIVAFAALAACVFPFAASAEECPGIFSKDVPWVPMRDFATQPFGTIGFTRNEERSVYLPDTGVECVTVPPHTTLHVLFNHRHATATESGYVSFKVYGLLSHEPGRTSLKLKRSGDWTRGGTTLKPFDPPTYSDHYPEKVREYETFYEGHDRSLDDFDSEFGILHGTPRNSEESSWNDRHDMGPEHLPQGMSIGYVMHMLQRVETQAGVITPGDPPAVETAKLDVFRDMLVTVHSPLGEGGSRTLRFRE